MKLQQLRYLCAVVDHGFNVTAASQALFTSQPGVSKQIRQLERELGVEILFRQGNRIAGLTDPGKELVAAAQRLLIDSAEFQKIAEGYSSADSGSLRVATTHLHARYPLLPVISAFSKKYPKVSLGLFEGPPAEIAERVSNGQADIGITTGPAEPDPQLVMLPAYPIGRCLITPPGHPLQKLSRVTLAAIAKYPLIVYDSSFSSGWTVIQAFEKQRLSPKIVLSATNADVIKAYVASGLGVAILQSMAHDPKVDTAIRATPVDHLIAPSTTHIMLRSGKYLTRYMFDFIEMFSKKWPAAQVRNALRRGLRASRTP
ncbi:MAG: LysR family transcriptional regulator [Burkholderiales bacterium]|nr:LysR family transcriptional regulator [Burkholderiales bacterium]